MRMMLLGKIKRTLVRECRSEIIILQILQKSIANSFASVQLKVGETSYISVPEAEAIRC